MRSLLECLGEEIEALACDLELMGALETWLGAFDDCAWQTPINMQQCFLNFLPKVYAAGEHARVSIVHTNDGTVLHKTGGLLLEVSPHDVVLALDCFSGLAPELMKTARFRYIY